MSNKDQIALLRLLIFYEGRKAVVRFNAEVDRILRELQNAH